MNISMKLSATLSLLLVVMIIVTGVGIVPAYAYDGISVSFTQEQTHNLNIYYDRLPCFYLKLTNPTQDGYRATATFEITDADDNRVLTEVVNIDVPSGATIIKPYSPNMRVRYGIYKIKAVLTGPFKNMIYYDDFSIVAAVDAVDDKIGINRNFMGSNFGKDKTEKHLPESGIAWVREEVKWSDIEKGTKNESTGIVSSSFSVPQEYDDMINRLNADGTKVLLALNYGNSLYENGALPKTADGIKAFANYCAFIANHFKGRVEAFEIWNEPNVEQFAGRADVTGTEYANLLIAAYNAIENVNKEAIVVGGSFNSMKIKETLEFYEEMISVDGIANYMDAISFHPYNGDGRYSDESETSFLTDLANIKTSLAAAGAGDMPIWLTEFGSSSWYNADDSIAAAQGYTEEKQAANLVRMGVMARSDSQIKKLFYYNLVDLKASSAKESKFGILDLKRNAKPAYVTVSFMNSLLTDTEFVESVTDKTNYIKASFTSYQFNGDDDIFVLWGNELNGLAGSPDIEVAYDCPADREPYVTYNIWSKAIIHVYEGADVTLYDMYGNETTDVSIGLNPVYAVCRWAKPYSSEMTIEMKDGLLTVSGCNANPGAQITFTAECDGSLEYIDQTIANSLGEYSFTMVYDNLNVYDLKVYDSSDILDGTYGEVDYKSTTAYYINDTEVALSDIANVENGDKVKAVITVTPLKEGVGLSNLLAAGAVYGDDGRVLLVNTDSTDDYTGNEAILTVDFEIADEPRISDIKFFLWNKRLAPLRRATKIEVN